MPSKKYANAEDRYKAQIARAKAKRNGEDFDESLYTMSELERKKYRGPEVYPPPKVIVEDEWSAVELKRAIRYGDDNGRVWTVEEVAQLFECPVESVLSVMFSPRHDATLRKTRLDWSRE
jgi:hypothetical protein